VFIYSIGQDKKSQEKCKMEWERVDLRVSTPELKDVLSESPLHPLLRLFFRQLYTNLINVRLINLCISDKKPFCKIRHKETPRVHKETWEETKRSEQLCFKINTTMPYTEEYNQLVQELPFFQV